MKNNIGPQRINSIAEFHKLMSLPSPLHPLVSLINLNEIRTFNMQAYSNVVLNFYTISIKNCKTASVKYGRNDYDFNSSLATFTSPGQILSGENEIQDEISGFSLVIHPDFVRNYSLSKSIKDYGFFSYNIFEALHLSDKEVGTIRSLIEIMEQEYNSSIDRFSQDVMIAHIELLLNYANRYYNRQFLTRKAANNDLLTKFEEILNAYVENDELSNSGLPSVNYFSERLNVSSHYLSDMLRTLTGKNTQQHIHLKLIDKSKESLASTNLTISEIAYQLGFEHSQSFNKFFKSKTNISPLKYRASFN
jgi:AraC family transcriptional activator of pobA